MGADLSPATLAERARRTGTLAIDTEFMGEGRYRSLLCLVQIAVEGDDGPDGPSEIAVIDPLDPNAPDVGPLAAALADPQIEVVLHAGRQDVALLRREWKTEVTAIFDTQVAAGFAGMRAQLGYEALLGQTLGVRLAKSASFTRWDRRPLSDEQVVYAREDVEHLLQAAAAIKERLDRLGRLDWAYEECRALEGANDGRDVDHVLGRLPRSSSLDPEQRAVARTLVAWREETASAEDKPIQSVLADAGLVEIARRRPSDLEKLRQIRGLHEGVVRRRGEDLVAAVARGREQPPIEIASSRPLPTTPDDAGLIVLAEALVRARADEAQLAYELLANRADLQRIVSAVRAGAAEPDALPLSSWRRGVVGEELLELLHGRRALHVTEDLRIQVDER
ncbi:unannotated protein [freshwater metagenome]|uniref:Unannotated protein n=1 Tax=freshwater metagenome TaxID=449393 RepID=A0A6J7EFW6_9ZZZZ|nr:ribonuclease D [Actinomycetota bacterium]